MPRYRYEAMDATGLETREEIEADSEAEVSRVVRQLGLFVTKVSPIVAVKESRKKEAQESAGLTLLLGFLLGLIAGIFIMLAFLVVFEPNGTERLPLPDNGPESLSVGWDEPLPR